MADIGLFEAIHSARAIRRLKPDPVPDELITKVLDAAIRAPSGSNNQDWVFVVVKDAGKRKKIGEIYRRGAALLQKVYENRERPPHISEEDEAKLLKSATYLFEHMGEVPVMLFPCLKQAAIPASAAALPPEMAGAMRSMARMSGSSIYPAVQNIILACRGVGLGTVLTTIHMFFEDEVRAILKLPKEVQTYALMPIGFPKGKFGPIKRKPLNEVAVLDEWGKPWPG